MLTKLQDFLKHRLNLSPSRFIFQEGGPSENPVASEAGPDKQKPTTIDTTAKTPEGVSGNLDQLAADAGVKPEDVKPPELVGPPAPETVEPVKKPEEYVLEYWEKQREELAKNKKDINIYKKGVVFPNETQRALYFFVEALADDYGPAKEFKSKMLNSDGEQIHAMFNGNDSECAKTLGFYWDSEKTLWRMDEGGAWRGDSDDVIGRTWDGADAHDFIAALPTFIDMYKTRHGEFGELDGNQGAELAKVAVPALEFAYTKHQLLTMKPEDLPRFEAEGVKYGREKLGEAVKWMKGHTDLITQSLIEAEGKWITLGDEDKKALMAMHLLARDLFDTKPPTSPSDYMYMKQGETFYMRKLDGSGEMIKVNLGGAPDTENYGKATFAGLWHPVNFETVPAEKITEELSALAKNPQVQAQLPQGAIPEAMAGAAAEAIAEKEKARLAKYIDAIKLKITVKKKRDTGSIESKFKTGLSTSIGKEFDKAFTDEADKKEKDKVVKSMVTDFMKDFAAKKEEILQKHEGIKKIAATLENGKIELKPDAEAKLKAVAEKGKDAAEKAKEKAEAEYLTQYNTFMNGKLGSIVGFLVSFGLLDEKKVKEHMFGIFSGKNKGIFAMYLGRKGIGPMAGKFKEGEEPKGLMGKIFGFFDKAVDKGTALAEQGGVPTESVKTATIDMLKQDLTAAPLREDTVVDVQTAAALGEDDMFAAKIPAGTTFKPVASSSAKYRNVGETDWKPAIPGTEYTNVEVKMASMGGETLPKGSVIVSAAAQEEKPTQTTDQLPS